MAAAGNGVWNKVVMSIMAGITLFTTGWAASTSSMCTEVKRIDTHGTQKTTDLDRRVSVLEHEVRIALANLTKLMDDMKQDLKAHTARTP